MQHNESSSVAKFVLIQHILSTQVSDTGPLVLWFLNHFGVLIVMVLYKLCK